jgi:tetratricopeptide (TPR) repeat protein
MTKVNRCHARHCGCRSHFAWNSGTTLFTIKAEKVTKWCSAFWGPAVAFRELVSLPAFTNQAGMNVFNRHNRHTLISRLAVVTTLCALGSEVQAQTPMPSPDTLQDTVVAPSSGPIRIDIRKLQGGQRIIIRPNRNVSPEVTQADRLMSQGDYQGAVDQLLPLWQANPSDNAVASSLKQAYKGLKDYASVGKIVEQQLTASPDDPGLLAELADTQFRLDENEAAVATIEKLLEKGPSEPDRYNIAARAYLNAGHYPEGIATYRRGRAELGDSLIFAQELGRLFEARREYAAAVEEHFRWLAASPESRDRAQRRITNLIKVPEAAPQITAALQKIVAEYPKNEYAHTLYGDLLFESGAIDSAFAEYTRADELSSDPGIHRLKGIDRCLETEQYGPAREQAAAFIKQHPDHTKIVQVNFALARAELGLGNPVTAVNMLKDLAGQFPNQGERNRILYEIGDIYRSHTSEMDSARSYFLRVAENQTGGPLKARALMGLAGVEVYFGHLIEADSIYHLALDTRSRPEDTEEIQFRLAEVDLFRGEYDSCLQTLQALTRQHPKGVFVNDALELSVLLGESQDAMNWSLSRYAEALYALRRRDPDSALVLFGQLVQDSANKIADEALFQMGAVHSDRKLYQESLSDYRSLISRYPSSFLVPRAWAEIGMLYEGPLQDIKGARDAYQTILEDYRDSPVAEEARLRLQRLGQMP